jgi:hypothetical protein
VTDFSDVERFARGHAACGGITPEATTQTGGGYLLTLTCACGSTMDRWITPEEARNPLPLSAPSPASAAAAQAPPPAKAPETPKPAPSIDIDLEAAVREALEAEDAAKPKARPAPPAPPSRSPGLDDVLRAAVEADVPAAKPAAPPPSPLPTRSAPPPPPPPTPRVPISNLEEAVQRALEEDARAAEAAAATARPRPRAVTPRLNADAAMKRAMDAQIPAPAAPAPARSRVWFGVVVTMLLIGGLLFWLLLRALEEDARQGSEAQLPTARVSASLVESDPGARLSVRRGASSA